MFHTVVELVGGLLFDWLAFDKHRSPWLRALQVLALIAFVCLVAFALFLLGNHFFGGAAE